MTTLIDMRGAAAAALALAASSAGAASQPASPAPPPAAAPAPALDAYPPAARAAGLEGDVTLRCARNPHLALTNCVLVSESPAGQGFGAAALAMAARSPDNPKLNVDEAALLAASTIAVHFRLHPPSIDPDLTQMAHVLKAPQIAVRPAGGVLGLYYPDRANRLGVSGRGEVHCHVTRKGRLTGCVVVAESPAGQDFGAAASAIAEREYRMTPMLYDGEPTDAGEANLTIGFGRGAAARPNERPNDPQAPPAADPPAPPPAPASAADRASFTPPQWVRQPQPADFARVFPRRALAYGVSGLAVIRCTIDFEGRLADCVAIEDTPPGYGFGKAALELSTVFRLKPETRGGQPVEVSFTIPIRFEIPGGSPAPTYQPPPPISRPAN